MQEQNATRSGDGQPPGGGGAAAEDHQTHVHPLVARTRRAFRRGKTGPDGFLLYDGEGLDVSVSPASLDRALAILDRALKAIQEAGFKVALSSSVPRRTLVHVNGEELHLRLTERRRREKHVLTAAERREKEKYSWAYVPRYDYIPTGDLVFEIHDGEPYGSVATFGDGKRERLEGKLASLVSVLLKQADAKRQAREEQARRIRECEEERRRIEQAQLERRREEQRIEELNREISRWHQARLVRSYVAAVKEAWVRERGEIQPGSSVERWSKWAEQYAARIDPLAAITNSLTSQQEAASGLLAGVAPTVPAWLADTEV